MNRRLTQLTTSNSRRLTVAAAAAAAATLAYLAYRRRARKLLKQQLDAIRARAAAAFAALGAPSGLIRSWVDPSCEYEAETADARRAFFDAHGFLHVRGFCTPAECEAMLRRMAELADGWDPLREAAAFSTGDDQEAAQGSSDYFMDSADRIHFFMEVKAEAAGGGLKPEYANRKGEALNKVGHGLHVVDDVFRAYCDAPKLGALVRALGWRAPAVPQSMYIFKQPRIGGEVTSHQDSCFLYTEPRQTCLGLWLALEPATLTNGCLWVRPGSHREALRRAFRRNPAHYEAGDATAPQMVFEAEQPQASVPWEGKLPERSWPPPSDGLFDAGFVPVECAAGDLVVFPGTLDHLSLANSTEKSRHTFQLHLVEGEAEGVRWSKSNWLQYPEGRAFHSLPK